MDPNKTNPESLLLVDDNPVNLQVLFQTLEHQGCKLLIAKNGEMAISIAKKAHPSLVLLDIMMPGIDGYEVCRQLKADPATEDIPIIFLSALGETEDKVKGLQLGAVDYVSKPFQAEEVIARVNTHLTIHRLRREVQKQRDQLENELQVVSEVQRKLLPKTLPPIDGMNLAVHYETSRFAGGDYYDFVKISENQWGILVADAEGHSAPAAVLMSMTCALFRAYPGLPDNPADVIEYLNSRLLKVTETSFITALYAVYDTNNLTLRMSRAGHPPPVIYSAHPKKVYEADCEGVFPMGITDYDDVAVSEIKLDRNDRILFYTDGLTERFNNDKEPYGLDRLIQQFGNVDTDTPSEIIEVLMKDIDLFSEGRPADDDLAMLACSIS
jgi:sigma-B regulation protein RsbU (phosphoserine phosphatase)